MLGNQAILHARTMGKKVSESHGSGPDKLFWQFLAGAHMCWMLCKAEHENTVVSGSQSNSAPPNTKEAT